MGNGVRVTGNYPITVTQHTVNGKSRGVSVHYQPLRGLTKRFIVRVKYGELSIRG